MLSTIESADLSWVWKSDTDDLISVLLLPRDQDVDPERRELRELALRLLLQSPAGMPTSFAELIEATSLHQLAKRWGGTTGVRGVEWAGVRGADHLIAAVAASDVLPGLIAELTNLFHHWAVTGRTSL